MVSLKLLSVRTLLVSVALFGSLVWLDRHDPDPLDLGTVAFFFIIAATSQLISAAFFYGRCLLNTFPHILSNVLAIVIIMVTLVATIL